MKLLSYGMLGPGSGDTELAIPLDLGTRSADLILLVSPTLPTAAVRQVRYVIQDSGLSVYPDGHSAQRREWCTGAKKTAAVVLLCDAERSVRGRIEGELLWRIGWTAGAGVRVAVLPVFSRLPRKDAFLPENELRNYPYIGLSRSPGDTADALWVIPEGHKSTTRQALNFEFWMTRK